MMSEKARERTWHITAERSGGNTDEYFIQAASLHDAYRDFTETIFPFNLAAIRISEAST